MLQHPLTHLLIGAVVKSLVVRHPDLRWDPLVDAFTTSAVAIDLALIFVFAFLSWKITDLAVKWDWVFGSGASAARGAADKPASAAPGAGSLKAYPLHWWFFCSLLMSAATAAGVALLDSWAIGGAGVRMHLLLLVAVSVAVLAVHELIHWLVARKNKKAQVKIAFHLGMGGFAIELKGDVSRADFLWLQLMPFLTMTIGVLVVALFVGAGDLTEWLLVIATTNAVLSGTDLVSAALLVRQVPRGAVLSLDEEDVRWRSD